MLFFPAHPRASSFLMLSGLLVLASSNAPRANAQTMSAEGAPRAVKNAAPAWNEPLEGPQAVRHVLNRLGFGPRPGDVEDVSRVGVRAYIEAQLHPDAIDDSAVEGKVASLDLLRSAPERMALIYAGDNGLLRRFQMMKEKGMLRPASVPLQETKPQVAGAPADSSAAKKKQKRDITLNARQEQILSDFQAAGLQPGVSTQVAAQLIEDKLVRAVESKRQLQETLVDFWSNHFNVDMRKNADRVLKVSDDRETIRPHLFGSFRELLGADAHSPAMLIYLDNARSTLEVVGRNGKKRGGLNENYGRELMELHTLGVDGGYTQTDVTEVARCFTGWSLTPDNLSFVFRPRAHDNGEKTVLGHRIAAGGGERDGEEVLDILAASPATAHHISLQLCQRFVADEPPAELVDRVAATFQKTNGDLPSVYRAIFLSPEFLSKGAYRAKIKSPFELVVSAVRALGGELSVPNAQNPLEGLRLLQIGTASSSQKNNLAGKARRGARPPLAICIANLGQPIFACQPPTGWSEDSRQWVSAGAIVGRLNFALALTGGDVGDVRLAADTFRPASVDALATQLLGGELSAQTRATIFREGTGDSDPAKTRALLLGSPEFQRR